MSDLMLDLETLGKERGCVILSIGAAVFDPFGIGHKATFHKTISIFDSLMNGFEIDDSTLEWWKGQDKGARSLLACAENNSCWGALEDFTAFFTENKCERVWCQGATFDAPILSEYFERVNPGVPWKFWNVRDTRTLYDVCGYDYQSAPRAGVFHNALDDATHQVACVQLALRKGLKPFVG